ncbi:MAG TPA: pyridoxal phosphate-dependent aminotransferase [Caldithrix abyssi]|uniref:Pyridoxal phosphate-dependent aminotransferase n=1 Tax=Caldithrix abyssi TaxID=187145 RepID=A0A7V4U2M7_CALAY|nr:pyridoxal phosphate-dependent aminotransferase [Caldithrix abyssi]
MPQNNNNINPLEYFRLRPIKAAKVSEISEATASSPLSPAERVNFHIGHPLQEEELSAFYFRLTVSAAEEEEHSEAGRADFLRRCIAQCAPYMPRGGYAAADGHPLLEHLQNWLKGQSEPLEYESGLRREIIFGSGGVTENLRVLFTALQRFLRYQPAQICLFQSELPEFLRNFPPLQFLYYDEASSLPDYLQNLLNAHPQRPLFLIYQTVLPEAVRRELREISLQKPLFFIELNDAPNHLSMAREARMQERVLRFLTPKIFHPALQHLSTIFILGSHDYLKVLETVHFELKGTPAAAEIEWLTYALDNHILPPENESSSLEAPSDRHRHTSPFISTGERLVRKFGGLVSGQPLLLETAATVVEQYSQRQQERFSSLYRFINRLPFVEREQGENLDHIPALKILDTLLKQPQDKAFAALLQENFLSAFLRHHPEYEMEHCAVVSGSSRTALSLLGKHCGVSEVISPDLGWTYEHCFPRVSFVPLKSDLSLDSEAILQTVQRKREADARWTEYGAVILNNPHNASGSVFDSSRMSELLRRLLKAGVRVIDDLSYQNVNPGETWREIPTLKQLTAELRRNGYLSEEQAARLITVHSLSKTDAFAGGRLAVIELPEEDLRDSYRKITAHIYPNIMAVLLAYLFYRNPPEKLNAYWHLRNRIFDRRMQAIEQALQELPANRNPYGIKVKRPSGSMYPRMVIERLPEGLSLDWLSSGLAVQGIGLVPLSTFSRTAEGYELGRKSFRLTLGGASGAAELKNKTRRVIIDLNRMLARQDEGYNRKRFAVRTTIDAGRGFFPGAWEAWKGIDEEIRRWAVQALDFYLKKQPAGSERHKLLTEFGKEYLPHRLAVYRQRLQDRLHIGGRLIEAGRGPGKPELLEVLEREFYKETLPERGERFRRRLFDRTVHPTQMYALQSEAVFNGIIDRLLTDGDISREILRRAGKTLAEEYLGRNVPVSSVQEAEELLLDLNDVIAAEEFARWNGDFRFRPFLSFWGDWDGSTRPSGQGHRLVAAVVMENVKRQTNILNTLLQIDGTLPLDAALRREMLALPAHNKRFWNLLNRITQLTNQLEKRYRSVLPFETDYGAWRKWAVRVHLRRDPVTVLWQHNDRLEKKMRELRARRREMLEYYFALNKRLRKTLHGLLPHIETHLHHREIALSAGGFRSLLARFVLTPRIHQKMILAKDAFPINTTAYNLTELNEIAGKYGNPGVVLALQISMSTQAEALIALDRKLNAERERTLRREPEADIPSIWLVPLFEGADEVKTIDDYLNKLWDYAVQSRRLNRKPVERLSELLCELFIAGSDLSQQVGQLNGAALYRQAKMKIIRWLARRDLTDQVRIKLGCGEPMQRQGGYYDALAGAPAFETNPSAARRLKEYLPPSAQKSAEFARSPLRGILADGDLRTYQSNLMEHLRRLGMEERSQIFYHVIQTQKNYHSELVKAAEPLLDTRLPYTERGLGNLKMLIGLNEDEAFGRFLELYTRNFRQILYGSEEDVVGIHIVSYFISRAMPALRDRPTVRPSATSGEVRGQQIIQRIAKTLPLANHGSLLRAIGHNRAQTFVLGVNQLTTGLFRALQEFSNEESGSSRIHERVLPQLAVYDILRALRLYHDPELRYAAKMQEAFSPGNSSFLLLREDVDSIPSFLYGLRRELIRRQGLDPADFFEGGRFKPQLLPALRPDLAVLMQDDLFNTDAAVFFSAIGGKWDDTWEKEIRRLLNIPRRIREWRQKIWTLIEEPIFQQTASFRELARAIHFFSGNKDAAELPFSASPSEVLRIGSSVTQALRGTVDDSMRQFLLSAVQFLTQLPGKLPEVPIDIIRALRDVERIIQIEEQALSAAQQDELRFYLLQMARLTGENG